jgi:hypothetical protein
MTGREIRGKQKVIRGMEEAFYLGKGRKPLKGGGSLGRLV